MKALRALLPIGLLWALLLTGCDEKSSSQKPSETAPYTHVAPMASRQALATQEKIVKVEAQKQLEIEKINAQTRLKELELERQKELALLRERERLMRLEHEQAKETWLIVGAIALILLIGLALLWYFDRRRQDKLIAYRDNLQKYFLFKENETRFKIAEKIIDTVSKQEISAEEKAKLIEVLHSPVAEGKPRLPESVGSESPASEKREPDASEPQSEEEEVIDVEEAGESNSLEGKKPWYRFW
ncbi:hypothetical protein [Nitratifractor sp.]